MKKIKKIVTWFNKDETIHYLFVIALLLVIIFLLSATKKIWFSFGTSIWSILKPFVYGFVVAFVFAQPIAFLKRLGLPYKLAVLLVYSLALIITFTLLANLVPVILLRISNLIHSLIQAVNELYRNYNHYLVTNNVNSLSNVFSYLMKELSSLQSLVPSVTSELPIFLNGTISFLVTFIFSLVISIFASLKWDNIKKTVKKICLYINQFTYEVVDEIAHEVQSYVHSLLILMLVKMFEYMLIYFLVGHHDWLILSIFTGLSLLVPFVGPMIVYVLTIITAVGMPWSNFCLLIILILVLSNVDEYVISPIMHARNITITPLWVLFSIMVGNTLLGVAGVIIAIPVYLAVQKYLQMLMLRKDQACNE